MKKQDRQKEIAAYESSHQWPKTEFRATRPQFAGMDALALVEANRPQKQSGLAMVYNLFKP
jgi:hypothetical protein